MPNLCDVPGPCFMGRHEHTLDDKRRVAIPKPYREAIDVRRDGPAFYLLQGLDPCLWLFTETRFEAFKKHFGRLSETGFGMGDSKVRALRREIFSKCERVLPDKQGRIALPPQLCNAVGIDRAVVFLGVDDKVELWAPAAEEVKDDPSRLRRLSEELIG